MPKLILQPAGTGEPSIHYAKTVAGTVALPQMRPYLSDGEYSDLAASHPEGAAAVWGVTPGEGGRNRKRWERLNAGDLVLFAREGRFMSSGVVTRKLHNPKLARELWGEDKNADTWEYVYFLRDIRPVDIPYGVFNKAAGYKAKNIVRGFEVFSEERSNSILSALKLVPPQSPNERAIGEIQEAMVKQGEFGPHSEEDGRKRTLASIVRRQGQPDFRRKLIHLYQGRCAISGCDAVEALEAAHIIPYNGPSTNHPCNGILLRSDFHTLFDLGLIAIDPNDFTVILDHRLRNTLYAEYSGKRISLPKDAALRPSVDALSRHRETYGL